MRTAGAVILGYLVMMILVFALLSVMYLSLGADRVFRAGSFEVNALWAAITIVTGFLAALTGGLIAVMVGSTPRAARILAAIVLLLGLGMAVPTLNAPEGEIGARTGDVGNLEAMQYARTPPWLAFTNPIIGALGVLAALRIRRRGTFNPAPLASPR